MNINDDPMILDKLTPVNLISIWQPRYHDKVVLINPAKVGEHNKIVFTKALSLTGTYYLSGKTIRKHKKESNGTIACFVVPLSELRPLQINERDWRMIN